MEEGMILSYNTQDEGMVGKDFGVKNFAYRYEFDTKGRLR